MTDDERKQLVTTPISSLFWSDEAVQRWLADGDSETVVLAVYLLTCEDGNLDRVLSSTADVDTLPELLERLREAEFVESGRGPQGVALGPRALRYLAPEGESAQPGCCTHMPNRVLFDLSLSLPARLLYGVFLNLEAEPESSSLDALAGLLGASRGSVLRYVNELEAAELLEIERRRGVPNVYRLTPSVEPVGGSR